MNKFKRLISIFGSNEVWFHLGQNGVCVLTSIYQCQFLERFNI